jgi:ABC-2 type transport system permease protein
MFKLAARKRSWIGFGAFFAVQTAILLMLQLPQAQRAVGRMLERNGYGFEDYYGGLTLAVIIGFTFLLLGALYIALVGGDIVAKEVEDGTMRMLLARPVSRLRVLATKWLACVSYTFLLTAFLALTALAVATIYRGYVGKLFVFIPEEGLFAVFDTAEGLVRYARAMGFLSFNIVTIASLAFMFSCFRMKPAAATILTLSVLFVDLVLRNIPYFKSYEMYFITYHIAAWARTFRDAVLWPGIIQSMAYLTGLNLTLFIVGTTGFGCRDLKN